MPGASLRLIGGKYNRKKISFPPELVRPSGARVREALFSCLGQNLQSLTCLDLFAGTGCLGLSALSRGANEVHFVEKNPILAAQLEDIVRQWGAPAQITRGRAEKFLADSAADYDIIFLDPPFADFADDAKWAALLEKTAPRCRPNARVYCESDRFFALPPGWAAAQKKQTGEVRWQILRPAV